MNKSQKIIYLVEGYYLNEDKIIAKVITGLGKTLSKFPAIKIKKALGKKDDPILKKLEANIALSLSNDAVMGIVRTVLNGLVS